LTSFFFPSVNLLFYFQYGKNFEGKNLFTKKI
jgi:hypothetical protein